MIPESGVWLLILLVCLVSMIHSFIFFQGSLSFLVGLFLIFVRWPIVGIILEIYGSIVLFRLGFFSLFSEYFAKFPWSWPSDVLTSLLCSGFWPSVKVFLYQIPVVGWILQYFWWLVIPLLWCFIFMAGTQFYVSKCSIFLLLSILGLCFMFCKPFLLQIIDWFWGSFV